PGLFGEDRGFGLPDAPTGPQDFAGSGIRDRQDGASGWTSGGSTGTSGEAPDAIWPTPANAEWPSGTAPSADTSPGAWAASQATDWPGAPASGHTAESGRPAGWAQDSGATAAFDLPGSSADTPRDRPSSRRAARENGSAPDAPGADWPGADGDHWPASSAQGSGATAFDTPGSPGAPSEGWPGSPAQDFGATGAFDVPGSSAAGQPDAPRGRRSSWRGDNDSGSIADWLSSAQDPGAAAAPSQGSATASPSEWPGADGGRAGDPAQDFGAADFGATAAFDAPGSSGDGQPNAPRGRRSSWRGDEDSGSIADWLGSAQDPGAAGAPGRGSATASPSEWPGADGGRPGDPAQDSGATGPFDVPGSSAAGEYDAPRGRRSSWRGDEDSGSIADWLGSARDPGTDAFDVPGSPGEGWPGADGGQLGGSAQDFGATGAFDVPGSSADAPRGRRSSWRASEADGSAAASPAAGWTGADAGSARDFDATAAFDVPGSSADGHSDAPRGRRSSWRGDEDSGSIADWLGSAQDPGAAPAFDVPGSPGGGWPGTDGGQPGGPAQDFGATAAGQSDAPRGRRSSRRAAEDSGSVADGWSGANGDRAGGPAQDHGATEAPDAQRGRRFSRRAADSGDGSASESDGWSAGSGQDFGAPDGDWLSTLRGGQPAHGNG